LVLPEQRAALDDVGLAARGGGAQILVALVWLGVSAEKMAEPEFKFNAGLGL
jgi:hypothetical protein